MTTCTVCGKRAAVTRDGRDWCRPCLMAAIARDTPIPAAPPERADDERQSPDNEPSPWAENAVRALEGD